MATIQIRDIPDDDAARRRSKAEALQAVRVSLMRDPGPGGDVDSIRAALDEIRGCRSVHIGASAVTL